MQFLLALPQARLGSLKVSIFSNRILDYGCSVDLKSGHDHRHYRRSSPEIDRSNKDG
jgi:hypothetical protein